jgi:tetratricopeptide (TPR) repeat protein
MDAYKRSLAIEPAGKTALQNIPVIYQFKKDYDKAIEAYNKLLAVFPGDPEGYFGIGRMYILKSDLEKGLDNLCKAYNIYTETSSPYRVDAQTLISGIYKEMKANGKEELFNKILKDNHISTK